MYSCFKLLLRRIYINRRSLLRNVGLCYVMIHISEYNLPLRYVTLLSYDLSYFFWVNGVWSMNNVCIEWLSSSGFSFWRLYLLVGPSKQVQVAAFLCLRFSLFQYFSICMHVNLEFGNSLVQILAKIILQLYRFQHINIFYVDECWKHGWFL